MPTHPSLLRSSVTAALAVLLVAGAALATNTLVTGGQRSSDAVRTSSEQSSAPSASPGALGSARPAEVETAEPSESPEPSEQAEPSHAAEATEAPEPNETPEPSESAKPEHSAGTFHESGDDDQNGDSQGEDGDGDHHASSPAPTTGDHSGDGGQNGGDGGQNGGHDGGGDE